MMNVLRDPRDEMLPQGTGLWSPRGEEPHTGLSRQRKGPGPRRPCPQGGPREGRRGREGRQGMNLAAGTGCRKQGQPRQRSQEKLGKVNGDWGRRERV